MRRRTEPTRGNQAPSLTKQLILPMVEGLLTTKALLREFILSAGVSAVQALFSEDSEMLAGPKGRRMTGRTAYRWGTAPSELVMGGRKLILPRPRVRSVEGRELTLPSVARFSRHDPLTEHVVDQILLDVSTRRYEKSLEPLPPPLVSRGTSKSAVSRTFVSATRRTVEAELSRSLSDLDLLVLMLDGVVVKKQSVVIALGITVDGTKRVLGLRLGSTENAALCTELLQDLVRRDLKVNRPFLCVIDGGGGLRKALRDVFGDLAVIQRCQLHKMRNLRDHLPKKAQGWVLSQMRQAYKAPGADSARRQLQRLVSWLGRNGHDDAAASLREGLEETLTVLKLRLPQTLTRSLSTTNAIENLMSAIRRSTRRVTRWKNGSMIRRWVGMAVLDAQKRFRRLKGHREMPILFEALDRLHRDRLAAQTDAA
jgi:putative transposase